TSAEDAKALAEFVNAGGVLFVDECGGSAEFVNSVKTVLARDVFPNATMTAMPPGHWVLSGRGEGMEKLDKAKLRPFAIEKLGNAAPSLSVIKSGKGEVIISDIDVVSGLLGTHTWGMVGYEPAYAE